MAPDWLGRNRQAKNNSNIPAFLYRSFYLIWIESSKLEQSRIKKLLRQTTLNDLWALNRTLIVTYQVFQAAQTGSKREMKTPQADK